MAGNWIDNIITKRKKLTIMITSIQLPISECFVLIDTVIEREPPPTLVQDICPICFHELVILGEIFAYCEDRMCKMYLEPLKLYEIKEDVE